jgi:hypothetical protein
MTSELSPSVILGGMVTGFSDDAGRAGGTGVCVEAVIAGARSTDIVVDADRSPVSSLVDISERPLIGNLLERSFRPLALSPSMIRPFSADGIEVLR